MEIEVSYNMLLILSVMWVEFSSLILLPRKHDPHNTSDINNAYMPVKCRPLKPYFVYSKTGLYYFVFALVLLLCVLVRTASKKRQYGCSNVYLKFLILAKQFRKKYLKFFFFHLKIVIYITVQISVYLIVLFT